MKNQYIIITILLLFSNIAFAIGDNNVDSLLIVLDQTISQTAEFDRQKEEKIAQLKQKLNLVRSDEDVYSVYSELFIEYEAYICDSAMYYAKKHLQWAEQKKNTFWINECKMRMARMYAVFIRFPEAIELLQSIPLRSFRDTTQQAAYYNRFVEIYTYRSENATEEESTQFVELKNQYLDSLLMILPQNSHEYKMQSVFKSIETGQYAQAEESLLSLISEETPYSRGFAMQAFLLAHIYNLKGEKEKQIEYLCHSAIADVKASVKENISMRQLALYLLENGDVKRANRYIKKSLEDANFYNARLRTVQIARALPVIDKTYQLQLEQQRQNLITAVSIIAFLLLIIIGVVVYLFLQIRRLSKARKEIGHINKKLQRINAHLMENNHIKEEYIGHFLNQCSIYLDKLEDYRKSLNKKAAKGQIEELYAALKSSQVIEDELREFYYQFDTSFIKLFPNFVAEFNKLLPENEQVFPKYTSELTVELRIFALIRLGITDSQKIASFLRYSITTIYNYRSKYRNKSLISNEKFEEMIMKIGYGNQLSIEKT